ncbi:UDP-N-acetylmuramate dehydrogenase [Moellerella wisconsensis]|uniref:UDP-N-acetylmuramate dehydrogenase n=1 Tax=Moellerella wisconsensis TaxID=158849 RepID=UPI00307675D8
MKIKLSDKTYIKIGGLCENYYEAKNTDNLLYILKNSVQPIVIIGNGTNLIFDSLGFNGTIIKLSSEFDYIEINDKLVNVGAATWIPKLVRKLSTHGLGGIDHCIGIPATLGGLITMNGGSQRRSISENIHKVYTITKDGILKTYTKDECNFKYRDSIFKKNLEIIIGATLKCEEIPPYSNRSKILNILKERREKFPRKLPNCGSVFMSSPELYNKIGPPGYIIESLKLKKFKIGGAEISDIHANFITNINNATSSDIISLVNYINKKCFEQYKLTMKAEPLYISPNGDMFHLDEL